MTSKAKGAPGRKTGGALPVEDRALIHEMRAEGYSIAKVMSLVGVTRHTVIKYQPNVYRTTHWVPDEPALIEKPIPFYPPDLPDVDWTDRGFNWTRTELASACAEARAALFF